MNSSTKRIVKYGALLQTASFFALANVLTAQAQQADTAQMAPAEVSEQVLVTGSLIHGTAAVGVPVASFGQQDLTDSGAVTLTDVFKDVPSVVAFQSIVANSNGGTTSNNQNINIHNLSSNNGGARTLLLIDGMRYPGESISACEVDPSIIPTLAVEHVDLLADGASATYGSDAVAGVVNVILRRGFDGAITQAQFGTPTDFPGATFKISQLYGRTWDGGDITLTFEHSTQAHINGNDLPSFTQNFFTENGLDNRDLLIASVPATISVGKPALAQAATNQGPAGIDGKDPTTATYQPLSPAAAAATLPGAASAFAATMGTSCGNCYVTPSQGPNTSLTWAALVANTPTGPNGTTQGTANERNEWDFAWATPSLQRNSIAATFDQNIMPDVQFFADAFYSNRRSTVIAALGASAPFQTNGLSLSAPGTFNPYYPTGAPAGLIINYDIQYESPIHFAANEVGERYDFGLNLDLPFKWLGKIYASETEDSLQQVATGVVNLNNVSAALGWSIPAGVTGNSFTKPAAVPYLNLFCDPTHFTCNSPATLAYIDGFRDHFESDIIQEAGLNFDGPIYTLPAGDAKAAVGTLYDIYDYDIEDKENYNNQSNAQITDLFGPVQRTVWASFAQFNIPVFGNDFKLPFVDSLNLEASIRYDQYSDFGGTTNPKVSATWGVIDGLQFKGAWGTAFRAPSPPNVQAVSGGTLTPINTAAGAATNTILSCPTASVNGPAVSGSVAAIIDPTCLSALQSLGGITLSGGDTIASAVRPANFTLQPEKAQNVSLGFEWAPTDSIFKGLDIEATYYFVKIRNKLQGCATQGVDSSINANCYITPANYGEPINAATGLPVSQAMDPQYFAAVAAIINNPKSIVPVNVSPLSIAYIFDGAIRNIGWQSVNGVDFSGSYNWDMGNLGAWNAGLVGNYVIDNKSVTTPGQPVVSLYSTPVSGTRDSGGRLRYRAHLGWAGGPDDAWGVTGFMNFFAHTNSNGGTLPPECFLIGQPACNASGMPQYAQYTQQYPSLSNFVPGLYTFDLQVSYKTHDKPANDYLKNIDVTVMVTDLFDKAPPFQYITGNPGRASDSGNTGGIISLQQRVVLLTVTKTW